MPKPIVKPKHVEPKPTAPERDNRSTIVKELDAMVDAGRATKTTYSNVIRCSTCGWPVTKGAKCLVDGLVAS